ncbi:hypothetical protein Rhow_008277 [Rhodococcus wratislaviensis]|uniref:Uncharacterized protein n=1 Tax=Rhodococcus wratislaviensis TaxID=44752 RepID=A0A402CKA6_RHOWR|nr:hypothetical protein Rhow_008277 [Rhodococcus wratislaviensis]
MNRSRIGTLHRTEREVGRRFSRRPAPRSCPSVRTPTRQRRAQGQPECPRSGSGIAADEPVGKLGRRWAYGCAQRRPRRFDVEQ